MEKDRNSKILGLLTLLITLSLACGLLTTAETVKETALAVGTDVKEGSKLLGTAEYYATQIGESGFVGTAQAMATQVGESGALQTVQAMVTSQAPGILETLQAVATQEGPSLLQTGQAMITDLPPVINQTPTDVPVLSGEKENFYSTNETVSYLTTTKYADVLNFYKTEMNNNGWVKQDQNSVETENAAVLYYEKGDKTASVTLSVNTTNSKTVVLIYIQPK